MKWLAKASLELAAISFWLYAIVQLFVIDIDTVLLRAIAPDYEWLLYLRPLIVLILIAASLVGSSKWKTLFRLGYILFYPLVLLFWKLPYFVFRQKSWVVAVSFANSLITSFAAFRQNIIIAAVYATLAVAILLAVQRWTLIGSVSLLGAMLVYSFIRRFIAVFKTTPAFRIYKKLVEIVRDGAANHTLDEELRYPIATLKPEQLEKWRGSLYTAVLYNRCCLFAARKLQDYQNSGLVIVGEIVSTISFFVPQW